MNYQGTTGSLSSEFISSGSKSYSYRLNDGNREVKFKGIIINSHINIVTFQNIIIIYIYMSK